jgi:alpha-glucuronidase
MIFLTRVLLTIALAIAGTAARAEDGYELWLRYHRADGPRGEVIARVATALVTPDRPSPVIDAALGEVRRAIAGLTGRAIPASAEVARGAVIIGTPETSRVIAGLNLPLKAFGRDGYLIRSLSVGDQPVTVIAAAGDAGALYGTFAWLRLVQTGAALDRLDVVSVPKVQLRMLDHWDNLDRTVERGYAGQSIWDWWQLPDVKVARYTDYARANASIGINGTVLNNVNAKGESLTAPWIAKAAALADVFRPYGIRVFLSARFSAPIEIGGLKTADPLDPEVRAWWAAKADEIYTTIPDFGGFLVKANSEGQPGPQDYKRTHADGANMLADAVRPHGGVILWRAFVYAHDNPDDRAKQAYADFKPLDGKFAANVIVQVKNGPIDFQPREPFHPLFGAMPQTPVGIEFQITKEYLGFATHLAYLGPLFEETLKSDTFAKGRGSNVARVVDGALFGARRSAMAGVANIGTDRNWSGSTFNQANWYAFGRFAWDPDADARAVAREWAAMTFTPDPRVLTPVVDMMMGSREAVVNYMTPLGLHHVMATGHHYGPGPWVSDLARPEWNPVYYHRADAGGIGFDRTASGSNAVAQYTPPVARRFGSLATVPEADLLWFHHVRWDHRMASGRTLWDELVTRYSRGVAQVAAMQRVWATVAPSVDAERAAVVTAMLDVQRREAQWWRDASVAYWQSISKRPLPKGEASPLETLNAYKRRSFPYAPGN